MTAETQSDFARRLGVAKSYITKLKQEGRVVMTDDGKVDVEASLKKLGELASPSAHHRAHALQLEEARTTPKTPPPDPAARENLETLNLRLKKAEADKREHEADISRMDREQKAGTLLAKEDVDFALDHFGATLRGLLENYADRLAPVIQPLQTLEETHAALSDAAQYILQNMHDAMQHKAQESAE